MLHTSCLKEFLEYAGSERWATVNTEFIWGPIYLEQLSTDGHLGCSGVTWFLVVQDEPAS